MTIDSEPFEVHRWHSPEYVESWIDNQSRETERRFLRKKLVSLLLFEPDASIRVLDIGAGAGGLSLEVLGVYSKAQITCQDFSETMLTHARQQLSQFSDRVTFVKSDLRDSDWTKVVEGKFDAVISSFVFHTVPNRIREIDSEVFHLVELGGCFLSCDHVAPPGPMLDKAYFKSRLTAYQGIIKAETGVEKSLADVEQEVQYGYRGTNKEISSRYLGERGASRGKGCGTLFSCQANPGGARSITRHRIGDASTTGRISTSTANRLIGTNAKQTQEICSP